MIVTPKKYTQDVTGLLDKLGLLDEVAATEQERNRPLRVLVGYTSKAPGYSGESGLAVREVDVIYVPKNFKERSQIFLHEIHHYLYPELSERDVQERVRYFK